MHIFLIEFVLKTKKIEKKFKKKKFDFQLIFALP